MKKNPYPSQDIIKSVLDYNPETGIFTWKERKVTHYQIICFNKRFAKKEAGCINNKGYVVIGLVGKEYYAHCLAWIYMTGKSPTEDIDHRDLNTSNNKWDNLRIGTRSQNHANKHISPYNTSGYKGVSLFRRDGTWRAQIQVRGENVHLGYYDTPEEAHAVYCKAAKKYFGEYARVA